MRGLITLVDDNHVDNCLKKILAFVYYGSIVNIRPKNEMVWSTAKLYGGRGARVRALT